MINQTFKWLQNTWIPVSILGFSLEKGYSHYFSRKNLAPHESFCPHFRILMKLEKSKCWLNLPKLSKLQLGAFKNGSCSSQIWSKYFQSKVASIDSLGNFVHSVDLCHYFYVWLKVTFTYPPGLRFWPPTAWFLMKTKKATVSKQYLIRDISACPFSLSVYLNWTTGEVFANNTLLGSYWRKNLPLPCTTIVVSNHNNVNVTEVISQ